MTRKNARARGWNRRTRKNQHPFATISQRVINIKTSLPPILFFTEELPGWTPRQEHGWVDGGLCPFHTDTHVGSFKVNLDSGAFKCFSCGAAGADVIAFYRLRYCMGFMDALRDLEGRAGIWKR